MALFGSSCICACGSSLCIGSDIPPLRRCAHTFALERDAFGWDTRPQKVAKSIGRSLWTLTYNRKNKTNTGRRTTNIPSSRVCFYSFCCQRMLPTRCSVDVEFVNTVASNICSNFLTQISWRFVSHAVEGCRMVLSDSLLCIRQMHSSEKAEKLSKKRG